MSRFAAVLLLIFWAIAGLALAQKPTAGAPGNQRTTDDIMRENKSREGSPKPRRYKVERHVERPLQENPAAVPGNSFNSQAGGRTSSPTPKAEATVPKAPQAIGTTW